MIMSAGKVKITPEATTSPAEAMVCTILFSKILALRKRLNTTMETKAAGIEADMVRAIFKPTKVLDAAKTIARKMHNIKARTVTSGNEVLAGIKGSTLTG